LALTTPCAQAKATRGSRRKKPAKAASKAAKEPAKIPKKPAKRKRLPASENKQQKQPKM
jgi:hypothetical protein